MKKALLICTGLLTSALVGCGQSPPAKPAAENASPAATRAADLIVGKWQVAEGNPRDGMEFGTNGKLHMTSEGELAIDGRYHFVSEDTVEVEFLPPGQKEPVKEQLKVKVAGDSLETTDKSSAVDRFKRVH